MRKKQPLFSGLCLAGTGSSPVRPTKKLLIGRKTKIDICVAKKTIAEKQSLSNKWVVE